MKFKKKGQSRLGSGKEVFRKHLPWRFHASKPVFTLCRKWEEVKLRLVEVGVLFKEKGESSLWKWRREDFLNG